MIIAIPKEIFPQETRVAATLETVKNYIQNGLTVQIEESAGILSGITDKEYQNVGANIIKTGKIYDNCDVILKINAPLPQEYPQLHSGQIIIADFSNIKNIADFATKDLTCFALEKIPRISRAQSMDILSSQSNLAGYKAVINAASLFERSFPLLMTAAGTLIPARVLILGIGVAGLQAIATAKRLGAQVFASDIRPETEEHAASLGAKFVTSAEIGNQLPQTDILITTAQTFGKPAPKLITAEMLKLMPSGSIIIDMAASSGGNVEGSKNNKIIKKNSLTIIGNSNLATQLPTSASKLFAKNIANFLHAYIPTNSNTFAFDFSDEIISSVCIIKNGKIFNQEKK